MLVISIIVVGAVVVVAAAVTAIGFFPELRRYLHIRKM
jgi:hypothetical protein